MTILSLIHFVWLSIIEVGILIFIISSVPEKKIRAAALGAAAFILLGAAGVFWTTLIPDESLLTLLPAALSAILAILFFAPIGKTNSIGINSPPRRVDERDTMFAREEYLPGTEKYAAYYKMRPELKDRDDRIRGLPRLLAPGGKYYDPLRSTSIDAVFDFIRTMVDEVDGPVASNRIERDENEFSEDIKKVAKQLGADEVGITGLNPAWVYSHVGRGPEPWGTPINNTHKFIICFTIEMGYVKVEQAPGLAITEETARGYLVGAFTANTLAQYIRALGYPARAHISGSNYQVMLPPAAYEAGLGELGRHGYLISSKYGSRVRLGAVTTDLPLIPDKPVLLGVQDFCAGCTRCAENCPSNAIPSGAPESVRGVEKWPLKIESCFAYWRTIGTDCGLCMRVCPFSHPSSFIHNLVRCGVKKSAFARYLSLHAENIFYGKLAGPYSPETADAG